MLKADQFDVKKVDIESLLADENEGQFKRQGIYKMVDLVRTVVCDEHIHHIQFNCQDKAILLDAQKHPAKYPTLMVRVAGYSVYFTDLGKDVQDDIINRTEHHV